MTVTLEERLSEVALSSENIWQGKLLDVRRDRVRLPNGHESLREYIVHPGAVVVIPVLDNGNLLFEHQFRYPVGRVFLEFPAGKIDPGEDVQITAKRELLEETGYTASRWRHLGLMHPCIGYSNERIEIFLAQGLVPHSAPQFDHGELLEVVELSLDQATQAIREGQMTDAKSITALFWAEKVLHAGW